MDTTAQFTVKEYGTSNKKVLFMLGGWKTKQYLYYLPAKMLSFKGYHCIVYTYAPDALSPDVTRTRDSLQTIRDDVLRQIKHLEQQGVGEFSLFGFSLGAVLACMIANKSKSISNIVLNTIGTSLAAAVWSWDDRMPGFKKSLQDQGYTLEKLETAWQELAPVNNLENLDNKRLLIYLAKHDKVIPYTQGRQFIKVLEKKKLHHRLIVNRRGSHAIAGFYNILHVRRYVQFLKQSS